MNRSEKGRLLGNLAVGLVFGLMFYLALYSAFRFVYGSPDDFFNIPRRIAFAGTIEGEAVELMHEIFSPAIWVELRIKESDPDYFVVEPRYSP